MGSDDDMTWSTVDWQQNYMYSYYHMEPHKQAVNIIIYSYFDDL